MLYLPDILLVTYFKFISSDETFGSDRECVWALMKQVTKSRLKELSIPDLEVVNGNNFNRRGGLIRKLFIFGVLLSRVSHSTEKTHYLIMVNF
jgi:hypothetical protein